MLERDPQQQQRYDACLKLISRNFDSVGYICQLYISTSINPVFICTGYDLQDALEDALKLPELNEYTLDELVDNTTILEEVVC